MPRQKQLYFIFGEAERGQYPAYLEGKSSSAAFDKVKIWGFFESVDDKNAIRQSERRHNKRRGLSCKIYRLTKISPSKIKRKKFSSSNEKVLVGLERACKFVNRHDYLLLGQASVKKVDIKKYQIYFGTQIHTLYSHGSFIRRRIPQMLSV